MFFDSSNCHVDVRWQGCVEYIHVTTIIYENEGRMKGKIIERSRREATSQVSIIPLKSTQPHVLQSLHTLPQGHAPCTHPIREGVVES